MAQCMFFGSNIFYDPVPSSIMKGVSDDNSLNLLPLNLENQPQEPAIRERTKPIEAVESSLIPNFQDYQKKKTKNKDQEKKQYRKNICGYITKKIVRQFVTHVYKQKVLNLCQKYYCQYEQIIAFYNDKIERITGPTHLNMLLNTNKEDSQMKKCFKEFFIWFLRFRYLRYLLREGKMTNKEVYVDYKNKTLLYLGDMNENINQSSQSNSEDPQAKRHFQ